MYSVSVLFISFLSCVLGSHIASLQLESMLMGLQQEVKELQKERQQDNEAIRRLQEKVRYFARTKHDESSAEHQLEAFLGVEEHLRNANVMNRDRATEGRNSELKHLNDELLSLRSELLMTPEVDDNHGSDLRTEVNFLRKELLSLRKQMEEGDVRNKEEVRTSSGRVAVHWLQKTVEDLRHEMKEMAISLNTTAALAEKERTHTSLELLRSDIEALGHRMDSVRLDREKNAAVIVEMKEDVEDLRKRLQASSADQSKLMSEVSGIFKF
ncbi:uncharacterized protein LOC129231534 [Uloborus diversus]|uniref:uncharacterized protein LOC129231534 n=1 Tax=Uloborus diversus TaxID=327109 RepID=UPI00240A3A66|nr:uncharacterized protein LOC129231534 [Uloborus diversus]